MSAKADFIIGMVLMGLSTGLLAAWFGFAVYHDCRPNPPLRSHVFGKQVPIEDICKAWKGLVN